MVLLDVMLSSLPSTCKYFGGICCIHLQDRRAFTTTMLLNNSFALYAFKIACYMYKNKYILITVNCALYQVLLR
jgi:hypothetical protein